MTMAHRREPSARPALLSSVVNRLSGGRIKYGWYQSDYRSGAEPVFAGGCPRSGTTLLATRRS